jgi:FkbM family methyltransferase
MNDWGHALVVLTILVCTTHGVVATEVPEKCQILLDGQPFPYPQNATLFRYLHQELKKRTQGTIHTVQPTTVPCLGYIRKGPYYVRAHATDALVLGQIMEYNEFHFLASAFGSSPPQRILDLGGNIGLASAYFAAMFPNATIVAVEPSSLNVAMAVLNTMFSDRIIILPGGIWPQPAMLYIDRYHGIGQEWAGQVKEANATQLANMTVHHIIPAYTVDQIMRRMQWDHIDFVKIDVECTELYLLAGTEPPAWLYKVTCATIEIHRSCGVATMKDQIVKNFKTAGHVFNGTHHEVYLFCKKASA